MKKRSLIIVVLLLLGLLTAQGATVFKQLKAGGKTYYKVRVREVTPRALIVFHSEGMGQIMLKDLSPKLQKHFGYDPNKEQAQIEKQEKAKAAAREQAEQIKKKLNASNRSDSANAKAGSSVIGRVIRQFGQPPVIKDEVDLRADFLKLELGAKNQGRRPSCAVFAVVSALEYRNAKARGTAVRLSEEYLIWATRKSLGLSSYAAFDEKEDGDADAGFALIQVVQALRTYGIPPQKLMPNTYGKSMAKINEPTEEIIDAARNRSKVRSHILTSRATDEKIDRIIHALNEGIPVVVGMAWPPGETLVQAPILSKQKPRDGYLHAVTIVGYRTKQNSKNELRFLFKNSWGNRWGINGYGWVTYPYLIKHLNSAVILDMSS